MDCIKFNLSIKNNAGLPHYPNPGLRDTLERYLNWLEPLVTKEELAQAINEVDAFQALEQFPRLERKMDELAEGSDDSYIYNYWVKGHLGFRDPICPYTSVPILYDNPTLRNLSQAEKAAALLFATAETYRVFRQKGNGAYNIGPKTYSNDELFGALASINHIAHGQDVMYISDEISRHSLVLYKNHIYTVEVITPEGKPIPYGNLRYSVAAILNDALNTGKYDRGVIVAESFDYEIIDKAYQPYDNLSLLVCLKSTGEIEKKVVASVTESLKADPSFTEDWARLVEIFQNPSLQMISFTITEKGYGVAPADLERGLTPVLAMGKVTALLYERFKAGKLPLTVQSMDNCSHNGDKVKNAVFTYASKWVEQGLVPAEFLAYVQDETKVTFPWSMIDKITPRPDAKVQKMLADDGFEDNYTIVTEKHTFTAPFVNAEETQYLCIEDHYTNGRPPLELGGVLYCDRETVDKIEKMKVCTCLNPLHTAMSIYGCMLDYTLISAEMADEDLRPFIQKIGYIEAMPVVVDPGVLNPYEFIGAVINRRLPNPFMPDAPQRIATDTSQKLAIRFGETIKAYEARGLDKSNLVLIPLVLAGYARYLKGIDDNGKAFEISPDPMLAELQAIVAPLEVKEGEQDFSCLKNLYSRADIFGVDLYAVGLGEQIEGMVKELYAGNGAVRKTLHKYVVAR